MQNAHRSNRRTTLCLSGLLRIGANAYACPVAPSDSATWRVHTSSWAAGPSLTARPPRSVLTRAAVAPLLYQALFGLLKSGRFAGREVNGRCSRPQWSRTPRNAAATNSSGRPGLHAALRSCQLTAVLLTFRHQQLNAPVVLEAEAP